MIAHHIPGILGGLDDSLIFRGGFTARAPQCRQGQGTTWCLIFTREPFRPLWFPLLHFLLSLVRCHLRENAALTGGTGGTERTEELEEMSSCRPTVHSQTSRRWKREGPGCWDERAYGLLYYRDPNFAMVFHNFAIPFSSRQGDPGLPSRFLSFHAVSIEL